MHLILLRCSIDLALLALPPDLQHRITGLPFFFMVAMRASMCCIGQHPENCVNEVRQKDRTFYIRLKNTQL
jgi:hypothetical protein